MYAKVNGTEIFFDVHGLQFEPKGEKVLEKPVTFVLHGGPGGDHIDFIPWLKPLEKYTQMVFVDHRSTGRSNRHTSAETWNVEQFADDVEELRKYLGLENICVMGESFGGMWSLTYAVRHPHSLRKLVLVDTSASWKETWKEAQAIAEKKGDMEQKRVFRDVFEGRVTTEEGFRDWDETVASLYYYKHDKKISREMRARIRSSSLVAAHMWKNIMPKYDILQKLWTIQCPTLVIVGRHDWITPVSQARRISQLIPSSKLVVFEKSGHMPYVEENSRFLRVVAKFLSS